MGNDNEWHLDKRVPITIIIGMLGQVVGLIWGAAIMFKDIDNNSKGIKYLSNRVDTIETAASNQAVQLGRIEENVDGMRSDLNRLLNILDRRLE